MKFAAETSGPLPHLETVQSDDDVLKVTLILDVVTVPGFNLSSYAAGPAGIGNEEVLVGQEYETIGTLANNATVLFNFDSYMPDFRTRAYNGSIPGPTISLFPGQTLELTLVNNLLPDSEYMNCCSDAALRVFEEGGFTEEGNPNNPFDCYPGQYTNYEYSQTSWETGAQCCNNCTAGPTPGVLNFDFFGPNTTNFHTYVCTYFGKLVFHDACFVSYCSSTNSIPDHTYVPVTFFASND